MSYTCKAQRSGPRSGVSALLQTILPVHSKWNGWKGSTPPAFFLNLQRKLPSQIHWGDHSGMEDNSSPRKDSFVSEGDLFSATYLKHQARRQMLTIIFKQKPLNSRDCSYTVLLVFCIAGTVKVKSSGIQVGDLIIVEKVCHKLFHPHLYIVWLLWTFKSPFMWWWIMRESFNLLQLVVEVKGVSKDFIIFWSMLSLSLSNSMHKRRPWA